MKTVKIHIALPLMAENEWLDPLLESLSNQSFKNFICWVCVNQPEDWQHIEDKAWIYQDNQLVLNRLAKENRFDCRILDCSSPGKGWSSKKRSGIGWARKYLMDHIAQNASSNDLLLSMDGDTHFSEYMLESLVSNLHQHPNAVAIALPYRHQPAASEELERAIRRYEIYLRNYVLQLYRIESPYAFTALGSAILTTIQHYKAINGMPPKPAGEDFYFLQNLRKYGPVITWNDECVYPASRPSSRVGFGTGPAIIKGLTGNWQSYPVYSHEQFNKIAETYKAFPALFEQDCSTPLSNFLMKQLKTDQLWAPMRKNFKDIKSFVRACHLRLDGLRILQYLKQHHNHGISDFNHLKLAFSEIEKNYREYDRFDQLDIKQLQKINNLLIKKEKQQQQKCYENWDLKRKW